MLERSPSPGPSRGAACQAPHLAGPGRAGLGCAAATCAAGPWSDPLGAPPRGTSPNCGPELRKKYDAAIRSRDDSAAFLRESSIDDWARLVNYPDTGGHKAAKGARGLTFFTNKQKLVARRIESWDDAAVR